MPELSVSITGAEVVPYSLTPELSFGLHLAESSGARVDAIALNAQIMIEAARRPYQAHEQEALLDLFGEPSRWGRTLKTMLWTHASMVVPGFVTSTETRLVVPCTYDLGVASAKYFYALEDGAVPLNFQFSGTVFHREADGALRVAPIPWTSEAPFRLPVELWRRLMDEHYPDNVWLRLRRDLFDRLHRRKARRGLTSFEELFTALLDASEEPARR